MDRIQGAPNAGIDIRKVRVEMFCDLPRDFVFKFRFSLLGLAIFHGQQDCAVACVRLGLEQTGVEEQHEHINSKLRLLRNYLHSEASSDHPLLPYFHQLKRIPSASECRSAAVAAAQAVLRASWQREAAQNGVAVCQVMRKMLRSKSFPVVLVGDILSFATEVPEFVEKLNLWNFVDGWMTLPQTRPNSNSESNDPRAREHETGNPCRKVSSFFLNKIFAFPA